MKQLIFMRYFFILFFTVSSFMGSYAQNTMMADLSEIDGLDITQDNIFNVSIHSSYDRTVKTLIKGRIAYRQSAIKLEYQFEYNIQPGINKINARSIIPAYTYSSNSLKELFTIYRRLPQGIYEYCITLIPDHGNHELGNLEFDQCLYHRTDDVFMISLVDPEDDAQLYEYNPMLSWTVNFPFAGDLKYRIRVAEIKQGQSTITAISRNNPIYEEGNLYTMSTIYPVYARPLVKDQPYAWTVDAYYKDLLLGGAEPWRFTIIEDSIESIIPSHVSYYDFSGKPQSGFIYALDTLKLKFNNYNPTDSFSIIFKETSGEQMNDSALLYVAQEGVNYYDIEIKKMKGFKHMRKYNAVIEDHRKSSYIIPFIYIDREKLIK